MPVVSKYAEPKTSLWFDFKVDEGPDFDKRIRTGHDNGLITINTAEDDDIEHEMARKSMDELCRTLPDYFRYEVDHYHHWDRLIDKTPFLKECRALFGDDRQDYVGALKKHYAQGPLSNWRNLIQVPTPPLTPGRMARNLGLPPAHHGHGPRLRLTRGPRGVDADQLLRATIPDSY